MPSIPESDSALSAAFRPAVAMQDPVSIFVPSVHDPLFDDTPSHVAPQNDGDWITADILPSGFNFSDELDIHEAAGDFLDVRSPMVHEMKLIVVRQKSTLGLLRLSLRSPSGQTLVSAVSERLRSVGSYFSVHLYPGQYAGKIRANQLGSRYWFQDGVLNTRSITVAFESRITSSSEAVGACRRIVVNLEVASGGKELGIKRQESAPTCDTFEIFSEPDIASSLKLTSLEPTRTPDGYVLNFGSERVVPSVKNFILSDFTSTTKLVMYKVGKNEFELSVGAGISALAAFVVAVSSIDRKLCTQ